MDFRLFRLVAALGSLALTVIVLELIRRRRLKDELWVPWLIVSVAPFLMGVWITPWEVIARLLGIAYEPALLFMFAILICFGLILHLTVVVSTLMRQNLRLAQDMALLQQRLTTLEPSGAPSTS
jgi:hypothetical protein